MAKVALFNLKGDNVKEIELADEVWGIKPHTAVLYDAIILARAALRQGSHQTKTRGEVRGGGRKPWRQKGTGRARQGSIRSPQWVGGGVVFGPTPRSYKIKMNKKERQLALKSALSLKVINQEIKVVTELGLEVPKAKALQTIIDALQLSGSILIITNDLNDNLMLGTRNFKEIKVITPVEINVYDLVNYKNLLITEAAVRTVEEVFING